MQVSSVSQRRHFLLILSCLWSLASSPRNWNWKPTLEALLQTCSPIWIPGSPGNWFFSWWLGMAWKRNNFETQIVQCSKDKSSGNHPRDPAGREIHYLDSWNLPERTAASRNAPMKKERVTKAGEEKMVESFYPARREIFYCELTLQKHAKHWNTESALSRRIVAREWASITRRAG